VQGKVALWLLVPAGAGIGRAIALRLAREAAAVVVADVAPSRSTPDTETGGATGL
jgi:NAD(P)-dependent dehydrogenase (short-subunit alcohol dehydrogenase family)